MSGWTDIASFAKSALSTAQKKIDNVLDIREEPQQEENSQLQSGNDNETGENAQGVGFNKLQEDFFSAFGLQSTSVASAPAASEETDPDVTSPDKTNSKQKWSTWLTGTVETVAKPGKSSWASWLGASPPVDTEDRTPSSTSSPKIDRRRQKPDTNVNLNLNLNTSTSDTDPESAAADLYPELSKESSRTSLKSAQSTSSTANDGWCTETLEVPKGGEDDEPSGTSEIVVDLLTPGDTSGFLASGAQLALVDDVKDSIENLCAYDSTAATQEQMSVNRVSSWIVTPLNLETTDQPSSSAEDTFNNYSNNVTPKAAVQSSCDYLFETDSEKSLCTMVDHSNAATRNTSSVDMSSSGKSQDTVLGDEASKDCATLVQIHSYTSSDDKTVVDEEPYVKTAPHSDYLREAADCVEEILLKLTDEYDSFNEALNFYDDTRRISPATSQDDDIATHSLADSFVQLGGDTQNCSPIYSQQKSETSSIVKGSGYSSPIEELETNASSDIEIISTPNGDNGSERSSRSGVIRMYSSSIGDAGLKKMHRRVNSDQDFTDLSTSSLNNLTKKMSLNGTEPEKKVQQLNEIVEARERKLLEISKENAQLADENEQLRRELQDVHNRISSSMTLDKSQKDHSERVSSLERKLDAAIKEKESLKRKCDNLEKEICTRITTQQFQQMIQDKDQQIQELIGEGEKLSKKELKHNTIVKKLREKEKENEKCIETQRTKLLEMDSIKRKLRTKEEQELKYDEMVIELKSTIEKQEKVVEKLQNDFEDARDKCQSYKLTLETCAKDIAELRKDCATKDSEIQRLLNDAEESKETQLQDQLHTMTKQFNEERQRLLKEVEHVKLFAGQNHDELQRRESSLRWEISQLQQKLQEAEGRNQELAESIATATKPLLRQIDSLQLSFQTQQNNWERLEKSLYDRLGEAERKVLVAQEKEQAASSSLADLRVKLTHFDGQVSSLTKEKQKLENSLTVSQRDLQTAQSLQTRYAEELESEKSLQTRIVEDLQKEKELLVAQFDFEKIKIRQSLEQKLADLAAKLNEKEVAINVLRAQLVDEQRSHHSMPLHDTAAAKIVSVSPAPPGGVYRNRSISPSSASAILNVDDTNDDFWAYDVTSGGYSSFIERLRSKLQQREGELAVIREELKQVQNSRDAIAMSLVGLSNEKQELENQLQDSSAVREQYHRLDVKYQALLQMYGEKVEENDELKMDLADFKNAYKQQVEELLKNS